MVNGQNGHFVLDLVVKFLGDCFDHNTRNMDFDYGHSQNLDYFTTDIPRFWAMVVVTKSPWPLKPHNFPYGRIVEWIFILTMDNLDFGHSRDQNF